MVAIKSDPRKYATMPMTMTRAAEMRPRSLPTARAEMRPEGMTGLYHAARRRGDTPLSWVTKMAA